MMAAVMETPVAVLTESHLRLQPAALHWVEPDRTQACPKFIIHQGLATTEAQLAADDLCVALIKKVITYCTPFSLV